MGARYQHQFWLSLLLTAGLIGAGLHLWWKPRQEALPARIPFPMTHEVYPCAYEKGIADHYLCYFGIFGFGDRLRKSDVLCIATSHFMYGLSASLLSERLSAFYGHPVRAYNLGLGFADMAFQAECLDRLGVKNKTVVIDMFAPEGEKISEWGEKVRHSDTVGAYIQVGEIWCDFIRDWLFDPLFPRVAFRGGDFQIERFLSSAVTRRWDSGDVDIIWAPMSGIVYRRDVPPPPNMILPMGHGEGRFGDRVDHGIGFPQALRKIVVQNSLKPILELYPFEGYQPEVAQKISLETGYPLILVAPDGLRFRDSDHLNAPSRDIATDRLFETGKEQGIDFLDPKGKEPKK